MSILDYVKDLVAPVSEDPAEIKARIRELQNLRTEKIAKLGEMTYRQWCSGSLNEDALAPVLMTIKEISGDIALLQDKLQKK